MPLPEILCLRKTERDFSVQSEYEGERMETAPPEVTLISPDGLTVRTSDYFECPKEIIIGRNGVSIDGCVFRADREMISESDMSWIGHQITLISNTQGKERATAICDALEKMLMSPKEIADDSDCKNSTRGGSRSS